MSNTVIKVENIGKLYTLGEVGTGSFSNDVRRWWSRIRGDEDPFALVAETNDRSAKGNSKHVWALKDVNFGVERGEVLGILGKNGAGKSTLLKILSRTTSPTKGIFKVKGRIASLLEVGTGFHPDLSGRDNIFLNGAILGMTKSEIAKKFDEIVEFSGVERYLDTPVKRYSSGMYVRLAFAVAAHLDPEILIIDEVLAVGDADFQKKCLGKMKDASRLEGRTVLFVSHNLTAIKSLCTKAILLENGFVTENGEVQQCINTYLNHGEIISSRGEINDRQRVIATSGVRFKNVHILDERMQPITSIYYKQKFTVNLRLNLEVKLHNCILDIGFGSIEDRFTFSSNYINQKGMDFEIGDYNIDFTLSNNLLPGDYFIYLGVHKLENGGSTLEYIERALSFKVLNFSNTTNEKYPFALSLGKTEVTGQWNITKL